MKFAEGQNIYVKSSNGPREGVISVINNSRPGPPYEVRLKGNSTFPGGIVHVYEKDISDYEGPTKVTLGLHETLKEISQHLNDDRLKLIESVVKHDYHQQTKNHYITLDIVLKENE